ncbi:MAG: hypothetical protein IKH04_01230 [Kiritimatiellae bacterium]|nr:hypothetical protein [Kiritimatiellia bacterium]
MKRLFAFLMSVAAATASAELLDESQFLYKATVTFPGYTFADDTQENFPVLVRLTETEGGFSYTDASVDGSDVRFTLADGTILPSEISLWDPDGESLAWVSIPELAVGTQILLYWGGTHAFPASQTDGSVWTAAGYFAVWHMDEPDTSTTAKDSAGGDMEGTHVNTMPGQTEAKVGRSVRISTNGTKNASENKGIRTAAYSDVGSSFVFSLWAKYPNQDVGNDRLANRKSDWQANSGWEISGKQYDSGHLDFRGPGQTSAGAAVSMKNMGWSHMVFVFESAGNGTFYLNNAWKSTNPLNAATDNDLPLILGNEASLNGVSFKGWMDEVRLRKGGMSRNWISTEYNSVNNASFAVVGAAESLQSDEDIPVLGAVSATADGRHGATLSWTLRTASSSASATVTAYYGTDAANLSQSLALASGADIATGAHTVSLTGLECATTWFAKVIATGDDGNAESDVVSFTTAGAPVFGDVTASVDGLAVSIHGSLSDAGSAPLAVTAHFGANAATWAAVGTWSGVSAARDFEAAATAPSLGDYAAGFRATGTCPDCGHVFDVASETAVVSVFGECRWTGAAGNLSWNDPGNWSSGTVPASKDTAVFPEGMLIQDAVVSLDAPQSVGTILDESGVSFRIGSADDIAEGRTLTLRNLERHNDSDSTLVLAVPAVFATDEAGTNRLTVAAGIVRFGDTVSADELYQPVLINGAGTVALAGVGGTPQPHFLVRSGILQPERQAALKANVTVGGGEFEAQLKCTVNQAISGVNSITAATNGFVRLRQTAWSLMCDNLVARDGGVIDVSGFGYKVFLSGGTVQGGELQCGSYNGQGIFCSASDLPSFFRSGFRFNQYGPATISVEDGAAIIDLTIDGAMFWAGDSWNSYSKTGSGTLRMRGTFGGTSSAPFRLNGGTLLCDNASGTPIGNTALAVGGGATLGGCGFIGGTERGNVTATGYSTSPATIAPGSIDETTGAHIFGTLTVGTESQTNAVVFGNHSKLAISAGQQGADALVVHGTVDISATGTQLAISAVGAMDRVRAGTYTILEADAITGQFATVTAPKSSWRVDYVSEEVEGEPVVKRITLTVGGAGTVMVFR